MRTFLFSLTLLLTCLSASGPRAHALDPGFLELQALGGDVWRVMWKVPIVGDQPMNIAPVLPANCDLREAGGLHFDGRGFVTEWAANCPGGLEGGGIVIRGLEATQTDVLVRYQLTLDSTADSNRLTAFTPGFTVPAPQGRLGIVATYTPLGIKHILTGIDHLMFVFALLLLIRDGRTLLGAVTAFTVAHSISLAAASLGWIVLPAPPVEALIALSIMFLAAELLRPPGADLRLTERYPWVVAFAFGLLHGLGFARALLDVGLPEGEVPLALFTFNVGVEIGQLLFIALVMITGTLLARLYPQLVASLSTRGRNGLRALGYLMGAVAATWFITRIAAF